MDDYERNNTPPPTTDTRMDMSRDGSHNTPSPSPSATQTSHTTVTNDDEHQSEAQALGLFDNDERQASHGDDKSGTDDTSIIQQVPAEIEERHEPEATHGDDTLHTVTLQELRDRLEKVLIYREFRTLQRYCKKGVLDCKKVTTENGSQWLTTDTAVEKYIHDTPIDTKPKIAEVVEEKPHDMASPVADTYEVSPAPSEEEQSDTETKEKQKETSDVRDISMTERLIKQQTDEITHLRGANMELTERLKEQNLLSGSLQNFVLRLTEGKEIVRSTNTAQASPVRNEEGSA